MKPIEISYELQFEDGRTKNYEVKIDPTDFTYILPQDALKPEWAKLDNNKCKNCPLNSAQSPYCPVALNVAQMVEDFKNHFSDSIAVARVTTPERIYEKTLDMQKAIFSIFGLVMATSPCPHMTFLRPMARFHLPFATSEETLVRSISMYLLRQYFVAKEGGQPDLSLKGLEEKYNHLQTVNTGILDRIRSIIVQDADANAMVILHSIALRLTMSIGTNLANLQPYFKAS